MSSKPKVVKTYDKLDDAIVEQLKLKYPYGFDKKLVLIPAAKGKLMSALPFETADRYFLIKMTREQAYKIIQNDEDYDDAGHLKKEVRQVYQERHPQD
jgi:hypothetical protein